MQPWHVLKDYTLAKYCISSAPAVSPSWPHDNFRKKSDTTLIHVFFSFLRIFNSNTLCDLQHQQLKYHRKLILYPLIWITCYFRLFANPGRQHRLAALGRNWVFFVETFSLSLRLWGTNRRSIYICFKSPLVWGLWVYTESKDLSHTEKDSTLGEKFGLFERSDESAESVKWQLHFKCLQVLQVTKIPLTFLYIYS